MFIRLKDIEPLCNDNCKIKNPERLEKILNEFGRGGTDRLQLVSDFDYTITKQRKSDGSPVLSSFGILNACESLPQRFIDESKNLHNKYRPIEIDPHIPINEKIQCMIEWWTKTGELLVGFKLEQSEIDVVASKYKDSLRENSHQLFGTLNRLNIPVLVFSAGLGNSVISVLKQANVMYPNVNVISNFLQYKNGVLDGFQKPMIHSFNKNETALDRHKYYDLVHNRDHIIVMGDSLGDADMANGVPASSHIIKIGFLYDHAEASLEKYMNTFDIVLVDDQTMNVPLALLDVVEKYQTIRNI
ncbi:7-methylguanosine phosphate-specific 5'-nucleotidase [Musca vetustissima]|uniref:7-methylguanosine phosphate-specific 5'-nucleotidase n=1 Tax=Musca vetustissima TaxID=27455 RepID=UPI002AB6C9D2|nr:7-methylguanosine phosphate-specific 5'-nucleotidase [Musca vetustissima]